MRSQLMILTLLPIVQLFLAIHNSALGQGVPWYLPQSAGNMQNPALGYGFRGVTPNGLIGANPGPGPYSTVGAPPIGTTQTIGIGNFSNGAALGAGSVAPNGTVNGYGVAGSGATTLGVNSTNDGLLYGLYGASYGSFGGYGGTQFTQDPISAYATAYYSGMANLIRAQGEYELEDTSAMINLERARAQYIDNQQKLFLARQFLIRSSVAAQTEERETRKVDRARREEFLAAQRPQPLSHEELDPWNGAIHWPPALMTADFDDLRTSLSDLFSQKARGYDKSMMESKISKAVEEMRDKLHHQISTIPLHDYSEARKFLDSMAVSIH